MLLAVVSVGHSHALRLRVSDSQLFTIALLRQLFDRCVEHSHARHCPGIDKGLLNIVTVTAAVAHN